MPDTYRATFHLSQTVPVDIEVPDNAEPLDYIGNEIARELDLVRFEIELGFEGGHIRRIGDAGPGIRFSLALLDEPDGAPCCPDPECNGSPCTFPGYVPNN